MQRRHSLLCVAAGFFLVVASSVAAQPAAIADFVKHPTYSSVKISPNGEYLAMTVDHEGLDVLTVLRTSDLSLVKVNSLRDEQSVGDFHWVSPDRLLFNSIRKVGRFAQPFRTAQWYAVNADGSQSRALLDIGNGGLVARRPTALRGFSLLDTLPEDETRVLMTARYRRSNDGQGAEVVLFDTVTGWFKMLARAPRDDCSIALDSAKKPRFAVCYDDEDEAGNYDSQSELYRLEDGGNWTLLNNSRASGKMLSVLGGSPDGKSYATQSDGRKPAAFGTIDINSGEFKTLFQDPISDPAGYVTSADGQAILGVVTEAGAPNIRLIDEDHPDTAVYVSLANAFQGQIVDLSSATQDGKKIIVSVHSDSNPGELYLYDRDTGKARFLMRNREWLDAARMATVKPFNFTTRDGLKLFGYLTIPRGSNGKDLPMIVNPHGGPMGPRDDWRFNWETQLLASRGYLVLQVNYRGSGGFGKEFEDKAYGQWAQGIMNDVIDATQWAVKQGYADKDRICIYGGSFGGYASLMAPAREPDLFKCAFGYVGLYDASIQLAKSDTSKSESGLRYLSRAFGKSRAEHDAMSPITYAKQLKLPIYLAAGARDPRCPPEHTEAMAKALTAAGNPPEGVIIQSGEMHGFYKEENNLRLYTEMIDFFGRHIGGTVDGGNSKQEPAG